MDTGGTSGVGREPNSALFWILKQNELAKLACIGEQNNADRFSLTATLVNCQVFGIFFQWDVFVFILIRSDKSSQCVKVWIHNQTSQTLSLPNVILRSLREGAAGAGQEEVEEEENVGEKEDA